MNTLFYKTYEDNFINLKLIIKVLKMFWRYLQNMFMAKKNNFEVSLNNILQQGSNISFIKIKITRRASLLQSWASSAHLKLEVECNIF